MSDDFAWFMTHYDALHEQYGNSFLAIMDKKIIGSYKRYGEAVVKSNKNFPHQAENILIRECCQLPLPKS